MIHSQESQNRMIDLLEKGDSGFEKPATLNAPTKEYPVEAKDVPRETVEVEKTNAEEQKEEVKAEGVLEVKTEEVKDEDKFSSKFAALARKERALREEKRQVKQMQEEAQKVMEKIRNARENPDEYLKLGNLDYDYLINYLQNDKNVPEAEKITKVGSEVEKLRQELAETKKQAEIDRQQKVVSDIKMNMKREALSKSDQFEVLNTMENGIDLAFEEMERLYREEEIILSIEEGLTLAEKTYQDRIEKDLEKLSKCKKFSKWFAPKSEPDAREQIKAQGSKARTLTNMPVANPVPKGNGRLTDEQRFQYAASLLERQ